MGNKQMEGESRITLDWIYLPFETEAQSLWTSLHDAVLRDIRSDARERTVELEFDVPHLREHHDLPTDLLFRFRLAGVASVRAATFVHWTGPGPITAGRSFEEQSRLTQEYQAKGREESVSWREFESRLAATHLDVQSAEVVLRNDEVALRLEGLLDDEAWFKIFLRANDLSVVRSDSIDFSLVQLQRLGDEYWDNWARRRDPPMEDEG